MGCDCCMASCVSPVRLATKNRTMAMDKKQLSEQEVRTWPIMLLGFVYDGERAKVVFDHPR